MTTHPLAALAAVALASAAPAAAPALTESTPADGGIATRPPAIALTFDQTVVAAGASFDVLMTTMPGMAMAQPMRMTVAKAALGPDGRTLTATLDTPLVPGTYRVAWRVANAAAEQGTGVVEFGVR